MLSTTLLSLSGIVLILVLGLLDAITGQARDSASYGASDAVRSSRGKIVELATSLLLLALEVLFTARLLERL